MNEEVILFYESQLPEGSPNATRVVALAKLLKLIGFNVIMLGVNEENSEILCGEYSGIKYELISFDEMSLTGIHRRKRIAALKKKTTQWLDERIGNGCVKYIVYSGVGEILDAFLQISKKFSIPLIYNHVEWYTLPIFGNSPRALIKWLFYQIKFHFEYPRVDNIIAISSMLEAFSSNKQCNTIRIPTIVDTSEYHIQKIGIQNKKLILAYAGKISNKDSMINVIKGIALLSQKDQSRIEFRIYGANQEELFSRGELTKKEKALFGQQIFCMGFIPYAMVKDEIMKADFTILLRRQWRNANAGFPTKVGESMASGVPVIANITSDLNQYLRDGIEGLVCESDSPEDCASTLQKALSLTSNTKRKMRIAARKRAEQSFEYSMYTVEMQDFLNRARPVR
jgi:glycosyltransferase involved in cell wall biosynthesis